MNRQEITSKLKNLIQDHTELIIKDDDEPLNIDSFVMMLVIMYSQEEMGVRLDVDKLDFDDFKSLNSFANMILASKSETSGVR